MSILQSTEPTDATRRRGLRLFGLPRVPTGNRLGARGRSSNSRSPCASGDRTNAVDPRAPQSIHSRLGGDLDAFAVFKPRIPDVLKLFQVVYIHGDDKPRHKSPEVTVANLKTICDRMKDSAERYNQRPLLEESDLDRICREMESIDEETSEGATVFGVASESSVEKALTADASLDVASLFSAGVNMSRTRAATREFSVTVTKSQKYAGGGELCRLIWKHGEVLFNKLLEDIDTDIDMVSDERRLVAIVTKKIVADMHISRERTFMRSHGAHGGVPEVNAALYVNRSRLQRDVSHYEGGIAGIQCIMFPMKRLDDFKFRFLPGTNVLRVDDDDVDGSNSDTFSVYKRWKQGQDHREDHTGGSCRHVPFNNLGLARSSDSLSTNPGWADIAPRLNRVPWIDIDLTPRLNDFAMRQCALAAGYREKAIDEKSQDTRSNCQTKCIALLRSAIRKCCYEATVTGLLDLANCYYAGIGVPQEANTASMVNYCAKVLRDSHESQSIWCQLLCERKPFLRDPQPERRIIQKISICGPRSWLPLCQTFETVNCLFTARVRMHVSTRGEWRIPQKFSLSKLSESERRRIYLLIAAGPLRIYTSIDMDTAEKPEKSMPTCTTLGSELDSEGLYPPSMPPLLVPLPRPPPLLLPLPRPPLLLLPPLMAHLPLPLSMPPSFLPPSIHDWQTDDDVLRSPDTQGNFKKQTVRGSHSSSKKRKRTNEDKYCIEAQTSQSPLRVRRRTTCDPEGTEASELDPKTPVTVVGDMEMPDL